MTPDTRSQNTFSDASVSNDPPNAHCIVKINAKGFRMYPMYYLWQKSE